MLTGLAPFHPLQDVDISSKVLQGSRPMKPTNASDLGISDGLWELLTRCWNADDTKRPQVNEILKRLSQESTLWLIFPPSRLPSAPSYESTFLSMTQQYGNNPWFKLACLRAHPLPDDIFPSPTTSTAQGPTEGMLGATLWTTGLNTPAIRISAPPYAYETYRR